MDQGPRQSALAPSGASREEAHDKVGKTFNVVNAHSLTLGSMLELLQNLLKVHGLSRADIRTKKNPAEPFAYKATRPFRTYVTSAEPRSMTD